MLIQNMFQDDINRKINVVIKVNQDDQDVIEQEVREYVITRELKKHFMAFFNYYCEMFDDPNADISVICFYTLLHQAEPLWYNGTINNMVRTSRTERFGLLCIQ